MAELSRLSQYCSYGDSLKQILGDIFVCGVSHERMYQRLLTESASLNLQKALDISIKIR